MRSGSHSSRLILLLLAAMLVATVGCGEKKKTSRRTPPPPTISAPQPSVAESNPPAETEAPAQPETKSSLDEELAKYADAAPIWTQTGYASWYGPPYHNRRGANGEIYDQNAMTAAHRTLPMGSIVRVTNEKTQQQALVKITDRGPFVGDRIIDLSVASAKAVGVWRPGTAPVRLEVLFAPAEINEGGRWCVQVGAFTEQEEALKLKEKLQRRYHTAKVLQFAGPTGYWVRVRVLDDDKTRAQEVAKVITANEAGVYLVRLD